MSGGDGKAVPSEHLRAGERLLWSGRPQRARASVYGIMMLVMGGLSTLIGVVMLLSAIISPSLFIVFALLWTAMSAWNLYVGARFSFAPSRQVFALTDQRALIVETFLGKRVASLSPGKLCAYELVDRRGLSEIRFGPEPSLFNLGLKPELPLNAFHGIPDGDRVARLIDETFCRGRLP